MLNRRQWLGSMGAAGAALIVGCDRGTASGDDLGMSAQDLAAGGVDASTLDCIAAPALTEGPFFVDENLNRSDLTTGTSEPQVTMGLPMLVKLGVYRAGGATCTPLEGAQVDLWHASCEGVYSDEPSNAIQSKNTLGETYLRGYQLSDAAGAVQFRTIYPGWYTSRTIHFHFKVRVSGKDFTSQLFIDDAINDMIMNTAPYNARGARTVRNATDSIYGASGTKLTLNMQQASGVAAWIGSFTIGLIGV
jgi:protocatechuate 3,4-dioxygenase beta subunit